MVFSSFIDLHSAIQFSQHHLLKRLVFPPFYFYLFILVEQEVYYSHSVVPEGFDVSPTLYSFNFFVFLGPHTWHMEVSRLGVQTELQLPAYTTATQDPRCVFDLHLMATPDPFII